MDTLSIYIYSVPFENLNKFVTVITKLAMVPANATVVSNRSVGVFHHNGMLSSAFLGGK